MSAVCDISGERWWHRVERNTGRVLVAMVLIAAWTKEPKIILGVALGGALGWANYHWLAMSTRTLMASISESGKVARRAIVLFGLRLLVIWSAIGLIFWSRTVDVLAVVAGFCALIVALMGEAGRHIGRIILGRTDD